MFWFYFSGAIAIIGQILSHGAGQWQQAQPATKRRSPECTPHILPWTVLLGFVCVCVCLLFHCVLSTFQVDLAKLHYSVGSGY